MRQKLLDIFRSYLDTKVIEPNDIPFRIDIKHYEQGLIIREKDDVSRLSSNQSKRLELILLKSKMILDRAEKGGFEYDIDGLIYLPSNLPVGTDSVGTPREYIYGTWNLNYKWKLS